MEGDARLKTSMIALSAASDVVARDVAHAIDDLRRAIRPLLLSMPRADVAKDTDGLVERMVRALQAACDAVVVLLGGEMQRIEDVLSLSRNLPSAAPDETETLRAVRARLARNSEISHELRAELTPLIYDSSDRIDELLEAHDAEALNARAHRLPLDGPIPFELYALPPALLLRLPAPAGVPVMPASEAEADQVIKAFWPEYLRFYRSVSRLPHWASPESVRQRWTAELKRRVGHVVDRESWQRYVAAHEAQLARGYYELDYVSGDRVRPENLAFSEAHRIFTTATGRSDSFMMAATSARRDSARSQVAERLQVSIGEYGPELAARLARTAGLMIDLSEQDAVLRAASRDIVDRSGLLIAEHTMRAGRSSTPADVADSLVSTVQEGDMSIMLAMSLLTAERVTGHEDDPDGLVARIVADDLVNQLTLRVPLTVTGTAFFHGIYFPRLVASDDHGHLELGLEPLRRLRKMRAYALRLHDQHWREHEEEFRAWQDGDRSSPRPWPPVRTGLGCPVAGRVHDETGPDQLVLPSGITRRTQTFGRVFAAIRPIPNDQVPRWGTPHLGSSGGPD